jgi:hypothetical protein
VSCKCVWRRGSRCAWRSVWESIEFLGARAYIRALTNVRGACYLIGPTVSMAETIAGQMRDAKFIPIRLMDAQDLAIQCIDSMYNGMHGGFSCVSRENGRQSFCGFFCKKILVPLHHHCGIVHAHFAQGFLCLLGRGPEVGSFERSMRERGHTASAEQVRGWNACKQKR